MSCALCWRGAGGEDFGGSLVQATDGRVYAQSGKNAAWNVAVEGMEHVRAVGRGKVTISKAEVRLAEAERQRQLEAVEGPRRLTVKRLTPRLAGRLNDFRGAEIISYQKQGDAAVRTALAWDDDYLYLRWITWPPSKAPGSR
jgi:hypothetical protein